MVKEIVQTKDGPMQVARQEFQYAVQYSIPGDEIEVRMFYDFYASKKDVINAVLFIFLGKIIIVLNVRMQKRSLVKVME